MTYEAYDSLPSGGQPVELYEFVANNVTYRYASSDVDVQTAGGVDWAGVIISRSSFTTGTSIERAGVSITTSISLPMLEVFEDGFPEEALSAKIYRTHVTDPDRELRLVWEGEITSRVFQHKSMVLKGEVPEVALRSLGLRRMYQVSCPYPVYRGGCGVSKEDHVVLSEVVSASTTTIKVALADCSPFSGGFVALSLGGRDVTRFVSNGSGDTLTLKQEASWIQPGVTLKLYPGCDKSMATCRDRFGNSDNHGGFIGMPKDNPFNTQVY